MCLMRSDPIEKGRLQLKRKLHSLIHTSQKR